MRARNLKPSFFKNEDLAECDPLARILFEGLWCFADREGRFEWRPKRIKAEILPYDEKCNVMSLLSQLLDKAFIVKYSINGKDYGEIPSFLEHNNPHPHEAQSKIPEISQENQCHDMSVTSQDMQVTSPASSLNPESPLLNPPSDIYSRVVNYLNEKTSKNFSCKSKVTISHIKARLAEGFSEDDFIRVIDNKVAKWLIDPKMMEYLRPQTLFGTKFESYLNDVPHPLAGKLSAKGIRNVESFKEWRPPSEK